jgi:hypothetical protein
MRTLVTTAYILFLDEEIPYVHVISSCKIINKFRKAQRE